MVFVLQRAPRMAKDGRGMQEFVPTHGAVPPVGRFTVPIHPALSPALLMGNAMHAVRTQCEVLDVGKYSNPSFGPLSQVFGSVPGFFWLPKHLGCGIFELSTISP